MAPRAAVDDAEPDASAAAERLAVAARIGGERMTLVPRGYLIAIVLVIAAIAGLGCWAVLGRVVTTQHLTGVMVHGDGPVAAVAKAQGTVLRLTVGPGDRVRRGDAVGLLRGDFRTAAITAPVTGRVLGIVAGPGTGVAAGAPILSIDPSSRSLTGWMFVPVADGFSVTPGLPVTARLSSAESVVTAGGTVTSVGTYPVTRAELGGMLGGLPADLAVHAAGPWHLVTVNLTGLGITGSGRVSLSGRIIDNLPALISLTADVETGRVRPIDMLFGGDGS